MGDEPEPVEKPPPCSQTITGRFRLSPPPCVKTFSTRQSSLAAGRVAGGGPLRRLCGELGPYASASRVPAHGVGFVGGMKRFFPLVVPP